jgi:hypothetical protein
LEEIFENSKSNYSKSPKKENRQPNAYNNNKMDKLAQNNIKTKRGAYNFIKNQPQSTQRNDGSGFITRNDMLKVGENRVKKNDENFKWILPEQHQK